MENLIFRCVEKNPEIFDEVLPTTLISKMTTNPYWAKKLVEQGSNVNNHSMKKKFNELLASTSNTDIANELLNYLLKQGFDVNQTNPEEPVDYLLTAIKTNHPLLDE